MKRLILLLLLVAGVARADSIGHWYMSADVAKPGPAPFDCTCYDSPDSISKKLCACGPNELTYWPIWFPANALGTCQGGTNDDVECTTNDPNDPCTGGGHCAVPWNIKVKTQVNLTDTSKSICLVAGIECTIDGGDWPANDVSGATFGSGTASVLASANKTITVAVDGIEAFDTVGATTCSPAACAGVQCVLMVQRSNDPNEPCTLGVDAEIEGVDPQWQGQ